MGRRPPAFRDENGPPHGWRGEAGPGAPVGAAIAALAAAQHGLVTLAQLAALGLDRSAVSRRVAAGTLHRVGRGVYAVGHAGLTQHGRWLAAVWSCGPGAALSHRSAAALWRIRGTGRRLIDVTAPRSRERAGPGIQLHRSRNLPATDVTARAGIPVTTPARTLTDLADVVAPAALRRALDEAEYHRLSGTPRPIPGRRGATRLGRALARHAADNPTRSALEAAFLDLLDRHGLPRPKVNAHVPTDLRLVEVDFLWPAERVVAQTDGHAAHSTRAAVERDRRTDAALHRAGFVTVRFTHHQVSREPRRTAQTVRALVYQTAREREESPLPPRIRSP